MNKALHLLDSNFIDAMGIALIHSLWFTAILYFLGFFFSSILRRMSSSFHCNILITFQLSTLIFIAFVFSNQWNEYTKSYESEVKTNIEASVAYNEGPTKPNNNTLHSPSSSLENTTEIHQAPVDTSFSIIERIHQKIKTNSLLIIQCWIIGICCFCLYNLLNLGRLYHLKNKAISLQQEHKLLSMLSSKLKIKRKLTLKLSHHITSPCTLGILKPIIIMPMSTFTQLNDEELELILLHELAHIKRYDYLVHILQNITETLLFFNPFIWLLSARISDYRERACDEFVVNNNGDAVTYAKLLVKLSEQESETAPEFAMALFKQPGQLLSRVQHILTNSKNNNRMNILEKKHKAKSILLAFFLLFGSLLTLSSFKSNNDPYHFSKSQQEKWNKKIVGEWKCISPFYQYPYKDIKLSFKDNNLIISYTGNNSYNSYTFARDYKDYKRVKIKGFNLLYEEEGVLHFIDEEKIAEASFSRPMIALAQNHISFNGDTMYVHVKNKNIMKFRNIEFTEHTIPYVRVSTYKSLKKKPSDIYEEHMEKESSSDATSERILFQERRHNTFLNERVTLESGKVLDNNIINDYNKFKSLCKVKRRLMNFTEREKENQILDLSIPTPDTYQYKNGTQWKEFTTFWLTQCLMPNESLKIELNTNIFAGNISEAHPLKLSLEYLAGNPYTKKTLDSKLGKAASKTFKVTIDGSEVPYETFGHYYRKYLVNNVGNKENIIIEIKNIGKKRVPIVYLYLNYPTSGKRELAHFETSENGVQQITRQVIQGNSSNNGITLYPNPVSSTLNISVDAEAVSGSIYTAQGQHVMDISDLANGIDVSHLKAGAYSFIMKDKNGKTQQRKFLKK